MPDNEKVGFNVIPRSGISVDEVVKRLEPETGLTLVKKGLRMYVRYQADREIFERFYATYQRNYGDIVGGIIVNQEVSLPPFKVHE